MLSGGALAQADTAELDAALALIEQVDLETLRMSSDSQVTLFAVRAEALARRLSSMQAAVAAEIADRSRYELGLAGLAAKHGCVRPGAFLEQTLRISGAEAARRISLGSALRRSAALTGEALPPRFPSLAVAVTQGKVGPEAAAVIVRVLDEVRRVADPADLDVAENRLVEYAVQNPVQLVANLAIAVRDRLDPDGVRPREEETIARRGFRLGRERNGIVPFSGGMEPITAALLKAEFDTANAPGAMPRFLSDDDRRDGTITTVREDGSERVTLSDNRTRDQRQHDVFAGLIKAGIRNTGTEPGQLRSTAEVTVKISIADLEAGRGTGHIDGINEPISVGTVERILCDAKFRNAILGNDGEILAFGKTRYPFSSAQRKAAVTRDGDRCLLCDAPASWADAHHIEEFYDNGGVGKTDVDNIGLFCDPHHTFLHHSDWQVKMFNGIPHLLAPPDIDPSQSWKRLGRPNPDIARASQQRPTTGVSSRPAEQGLTTNNPSERITFQTVSN